MKPLIRRWSMLVLCGLTGPGLALAQTTGPSAFAKKKFDSDSVPMQHSGSATASVPASAGGHVAWPSCSKQTALIAELEKTLALQVKRIEELETAVKVASKGGAK